MEVETMIGLEYIVNLYGMQQKDLAEKLGIRKQNITYWLKGAQKIPKKYLPILAEIFKVPQEYLQKELEENDMHVLVDMVLTREIGERLHSELIEKHEAGLDGVLSDETEALLLQKVLNGIFVENRKALEDIYSELKKMVSSIKSDSDPIINEIIGYVDTITNLSLFIQYDKIKFEKVKVLVKELAQGLDKFNNQE